MIGLVGQQGIGAPATEIRSPGRRADAVGQIAKKVVAEARQSGAELPRNAQGVAASAVARGIDAASLFAAQVADAGADVVPVGDNGEPAVSGAAEGVGVVEVEAGTDGPADTSDPGAATPPAAEAHLAVDLAVADDSLMAVLSELRPEGVTPPLAEGV